MIYDYLKDNNISNLGCVAIINDSYYLFIITEKEIMKGIPIDDNEGIYDGLQYNDIALVGVNIIGEDDFIDASQITDDNMVSLLYAISILYIYTLKTDGLIIEDIVDLSLFEYLIDKVIDDFETNNYLKNLS
ncbi:hypothetical protein [Trichloromonas sp.]|uniref:hypothetical protein n=1 Tax=Trichloromonas sp. TaxID=3069249 RepID=UPI002A437DED|nr:hypothetical protein [Trichloromonas sp.]